MNYVVAGGGGGGRGGGGLNTHIPLGRDLCRQAFKQAHRQETQLGSETGRQVCRAGSETWAEAYMQACRVIEINTQ